MRTVFDKIGERFYETGIDQVVLYPISANNTYDKGYAWNGVTGVNETPDGGEPEKLYADNIQYLTLYSTETLGGTITAYQSPEEFDACDGSAELVPGANIGQQSRKMFGLCYRTRLGNDTQGVDYGYILHLLYGCQASPSEKEFSTINDSPEAAELSWEFTTTPVPVTGFKPTSLVTIDSTKVDAAKLKALENILYGTDAGDSYIAVTPVGTENPTTEGWYELVSGSYVLSADTEVVSGKTYYEKQTTTDSDPRLPLPDEIKRILAAG